MSGNLIQFLPFDSELFGYPVGKVQLEQGLDEQDLLKAMQAYQLVYLFSEQIREFTSPEIKLQDRRVTFKKALDSPTPPSLIQRYQGELSPKLMELAFLSGRYSRFKTDPRLVNQEFQKLYRLWISQAREKNQVLCSAELEGMASYSVSDGQASVGLLAVGERFQRKGWGRLLIEAVEFQAKSAGADYLCIGTQEENFQACSLYESMGYRPSSRKYIYHYWKS